MPARLQKRHFVVLAGISLLLSFQNCAPPAADSGLNSASSYQSKLPFAYQPVLDTIAYMSCSEISAAVEPRAYFSFRAGAYNPQTGGISISDAFRDATSYYTPTDRARAFAESDLNGNTRLTLSIRQAGNFQKVWATDQISPGEETDSFLPPLDNDEIAGPLAASTKGQMINYFPGTNTQRLVEASLRFMKFENVASDTRINIDSGASMLVAGFSNTADESDVRLRSPYDVALPGQTLPANSSNTSSVFGRGYQFNFALPIGLQAGDRRVISSSGIREMDLTNKQTISSNWDCGTNYQFIVVRPEDQFAGRVTCLARPDVFSNATQQAALDAVRRVLRVEDWFVDVANHCVMPKRTGDYCYGSTLGARTIQYGLASCLTSATTECPHFVSVCIRH